MKDIFKAVVQGLWIGLVALGAMFFMFQCTGTLFAHEHVEVIADVEITEADDTIPEVYVINEPTQATIQIPPAYDYQHCKERNRFYQHMVEHYSAKEDQEFWGGTVQKYQDLIRECRR